MSDVPVSSEAFGEPGLGSEESGFPSPSISAATAVKLMVIDAIEARQLVTV